MNLLKGLMEATRRVNEDELFPDAKVEGNEPEEIVAPEETAPVEEVPAEGVETEETQDIEITDELIAELAETNPAISEVDPAQFKEGLENEIKFIELLGGDINTIASLVLAHIEEFPGKDYYAALAEFENGLKEDEPVEGDEVAPVEGGDEVAAEGELDADQPAFEDGDEEVVEEAKEKQAKGKAMSQVKNESKDAKKDEKDEKKTAAKEKEQEIELKKKQAADDKKKK